MQSSANAESIELKNIVKSYDGNVVLKGISLTIKAGEFLVLVGPSGCGKSTLLRCIAGLEEITDGELYIDGRLSNRVAPKDRNLAMVFQSYALYPHMTVAENLAFSLTVRKTDKREAERRVAAVAEQLGLTTLLKRYPKQLSGGQRQRVAVGRAIVRRPRAFLFDEPLSNLDAALRGQMRVELKKLHSQMGATSIYVTHDQIEAMTLADRIVVLKDGIVQQIGAPYELFNKPANQFVGSFIGSPPMNFLEAAMERGSSSLVGNGIELELPEKYRTDCRGLGSVVVGLRPTAFLLDDDAEGHCEAMVDVIEPVGWESHVHVIIGEKRVIAQIPSERAARLKAGDQIVLSVRAEDVHVFDGKNGAAICPAVKSG